MKRFTETTKWEKDWYCNLPVKHKCLWSFLCDRCDCAGVWEPNFKLVTYLIGEPIEEQDLHQMSGRVIQLECGKYFLRGFIAFQYGELSAECKAHIPVIRSLRRHLSPAELTTLCKGYAKAIYSLKEKEKEEEKEKEGGAGETIGGAIPTVAEVMAFASMGANIPADFCCHYHETKEIKKTWLNGYGQLIDWKKEIVKWWAGSRSTWSNNKQYGKPDINHSAGF